MNKEEIEKAIEILKQPITVNCTDYKYFDQDNYDKLISAYDNALWLLDIYEQVIESYQELKDRIDKALEKIQLLIDIGFDYDGFNKADSLKTLIDELVNFARDSRAILKGDKE